MARPVRRVEGKPSSRARHEPTPALLNTRPDALLPPTDLRHTLNRRIARPVTYSSGRRTIYSSAGGTEGLQPRKQTAGQTYANKDVGHIARPTSRRDGPPPSRGSASPVRVATKRKGEQR